MFPYLPQQQKWVFNFIVTARLYMKEHILIISPLKLFLVSVLPALVAMDVDIYLPVRLAATPVGTAAMVRARRSATYTNAAAVLPLARPPTRVMILQIVQLILIAPGGAVFPEVVVQKRARPAPAVLAQNIAMDMALVIVL